MSFADDFNDGAFPSMLTYLGETVSYTPVGGTASEVMGVWTERNYPSLEDDSGIAIAGVAIFQVSSNAVASPKRGDQVDFAGESWQVLDVRKTAALHELTLHKTERKLNSVGVKWNRGKNG